jgi:hypothetical protein
VPISAKPENIVMGPYNVSFDTGLSASDYTTHIVPAVNLVGFTGTPYARYTGWINKTVDTCSRDEMNETICYKPFSTISVAEYHAPVSSDYIKRLMEHDLQLMVPLGYSEALIMNRTIDNTSGMVGRCSKFLPDKIYTQSRYLLAPNRNDTSCEVVVIIGLSPKMDQGTENIIDTIHLEKI